MPKGALEMLGRLKSFGASLASHWILTLVFVAVVVVFLAAPVLNVLEMVPAVGPWVKARRAA